MKCKYCKRPAGILSRKHKECEKTHQNSSNMIISKLSENFVENKIKSYSELKLELETIMKDGFITDTEFNSLTFEAIYSILTNEIQADSFSLQEFIDSTPKELKHRIASHYAYKKYLETFLLTYFRSLSIDERIDDIHNAFIAKLKEIDGLVMTLYNSFIAFLDEKISHFLEDDLIDESEEAFLSNFIYDLSLKEYPEFNDCKAHQKLVQCLILRDLREGKEITRLQIESLPILLGKKEQILWVYNGIQVYEESTVKRYVGGSQGVSIRICKGVYYKTSSSKGTPIETQQSKNLGFGPVLITNKQIYFLGDKQIKLAYSKIISFSECANGLIFTKDGVNPKSYTFVGVDAWFLINAIQLSIA